MKNVVSNRRLNPWFLLPALVLSLLPCTKAEAFTYRDEELLLTFHKDGFDDIEYNLGAIAPLLSLTNGAVTNIGGWNAGLLTATYGASLTNGVRVSLVSSTSQTSTNKRIWLTSSDLNSKPLDRTASQWQALWSKANAIGTQPQIFTVTSSVPTFVASPSLLASYTYIASNSGSQPSLVPTLGGASAFNVESGLPAELRLIEVKPSTAVPKPESRVAGTFRVSAAGALQFTAGSVATPAPTRITQVVRDGAGVKLTFNTVAGVKYRLRYNTALAGTVSSWSIGGEVVTGTGSPATLGDTPPGATRFYVVESF